MRRFRWLALVLALVMVAAACSRSDDDSSGSEGDTTTSTEGSGGAKTRRLRHAEGRLSGRVDRRARRPPGVTPTEIKIATFSDVGFAGRPGLNQEFFDTADVFSQWCNDRGGINGRKIVVDKRDAALTNVKAQMTSPAAEDFMLVGGGAVFDQDGVTTRLECLMPDIAGFVVSPEARGADLVVQPVPNYHQDPASRRPASTSRRSSPTRRRTTASSPVTSRPRGSSASSPRRSSTRSAGRTSTTTSTRRSAPTSWTPYAQALKDKGVEGLIWVGEPEFLGKLIEAMNEHRLRARVHPHRRQPLRPEADRHGGAAIKDNVYIRSAFFPFEEAKAGTATQQYLDAFAEYLPGRQEPAPTSACRRSRPGCCSRRRPRSAATTSPASASTTTRRRSPSGPAAGSTPSRTPATA